VSAPNVAPVTAVSQSRATICHIPPGNPAKARTITVGRPAVPAHLAHGDTLGACGSGGGGGGGGGSGGGTGCLLVGMVCQGGDCCNGLTCIQPLGELCVPGAPACICQVVVN
jgi:hypothetical protein